eukprot:g33918.t1
MSKGDVIFWYLCGTKVTFHYMFADNTTLVGRISNNDESEYRKEIDGLMTGCNENGLSLNVSKTKELIIDVRKKGEHIYINRAEIEGVECIKFLGVMTTDNLSWTSHVDATVKVAQHASSFSGGSGNLDLKKLQKVVCIALTITEANLPSMDSIYTARCHGRAANTIKDPSHPSYALLQPLALGRRYRSLNTFTSRFKDSFFPAIIRLTNG